MQSGYQPPSHSSSFLLSADARVSETDYYNDQTWELTFSRGEPLAMAIQTTFGLRARSMRIFPRFGDGDEIKNDPGDFHTPVSIGHHFPNFIKLLFEPFPDLEVSLEYWIPHSHAISGRVNINNLGRKSRTLLLEWAAMLFPDSSGQRMAPDEIQNTRILSGKSGNLTPVFFLTGSTEAATSPFTSLLTRFILPEQEQRHFTWVLAACNEPLETFEVTRQILQRNWEAERTRLELLNAGHLEIHTGNPEWDEAFTLSQRAAFRLFLGSTQHLPYPSFVMTRQPDQGFSQRADGNDYNHLWSGQTPLESYYLASLILPTAPVMAQGLVENFLATLDENGHIDWKPGLGGQRSQILATPLLASLAWKIFQSSADKKFLERVLPGLLSFLDAWLSAAQDQDGDGVPEWSNALQTNLDDHPTFSQWNDWSRGVDITSVEGPDLCALLYGECQALLKMAELLDRPETIPLLQETSQRLKEVVNNHWNDQAGICHYWDRDSHITSLPETLGIRSGNGEILIHRDFSVPVRIQFHIQLQNEATRKMQVYIHGSGPSGLHRVETIGADRFHRYLDHCIATSDRIYSVLEHVQIQGLDDHDHVTLQTVGLNDVDLTLMLPLWAGLTDIDQAAQLIEKNLTNPESFWQSYGIPVCPHETTERDPTRQMVHFPWNQLIGEGLLAYGFRTEAAELVLRMMQAVTDSLKNEGTYYRSYHSQTGKGVGDRNILNGLAPLGLFLQTLGVRIYNAHQVAIEGKNPFPWPVTVKYRGLTVLRQKQKTSVIFPNGQTATINDPEPILISIG